MKNLVAYIAAIVGWVFVSFAVTFLGGMAAAIFYDREELDFDRSFLLVVVGLGVVALGVALIRWARSALGKPGGSAVARAVLALILIAFGVAALASPPDSTSHAEKDYYIGAGISAVILGGVLVLEAAWHRSSRRQVRSLTPPRG